MKIFKTYAVAVGLAAVMIAVFAGSSLLPAVASAQAAPVKQDGGVGVNDPVKDDFQLVSCTGVLKADKSGKVCDFNQLIIMANRIIKFLLLLAIPLTIGMVLYTGWLYLTANGAPGQLEKAKKMFVPVVLGLFWIGASYIVIYTLIDKFVDPDHNSNIGAATKAAIKVLDSNQ